MDIFFTMWPRLTKDGIILLKYHIPKWGQHATIFALINLLSEELEDCSEMHIKMPYRIVDLGHFNLHFQIGYRIRWAEGGSPYKIVDLGHFNTHSKSTIPSGGAWSLFRNAY